MLQRLKIARTTLLLDQPFFGALAMHLEQQIDETQPTACTDGTVIKWNSAFVASLTDAELIGVMAHEVMHCASGHPWRRDARDPQRWNVAADYAINDIITSAGLKLPKSALLDPQFSGRSSEWIYDRLPPGDPNGQGQGDPGGCGGVHDATAGTDQTNQPTEADWQQITKQAALAAKARGALPAAMEGLINQLTKPRVDWRAVLRRFMQDVVSADYSWAQPNRRYIAQGLYLPALRSIACGKIAIAVDTSGSIDQTLLTQFCSEVNTIAAELEPASIDVLYCDTKIHRIETFDRGEAIEMHAIGRGGTSFVPVFDHFKDDPPVVLVYLTDLDGSFPSYTPDYPVIWCTEREQAVPFGDVVVCE